MAEVNIIVKSSVNPVVPKFTLPFVTIKYIRNQGKEIKKLKDTLCNLTRLISAQQLRMSNLEKLLRILCCDEGKKSTTGTEKRFGSVNESTKMFDTSIRYREASVKSLYAELAFRGTYKMASPPTGSPRPGTPTTQPGTFDDQFKLFAKFGDTKNTGEVITLSNSDKWFKQARIIDGKTVTTTDTGIYFKKIAKTKRALNKKEYLLFLDTVASNRKVDFEGIKEKLSSCGPPATSGTTPIATGGAVSRLTDHTKFTGTHKQRFDDSGKGRGKEGRVDIPDDSGYVRGYKAQGSYNKTH